MSFRDKSEVFQTQEENIKKFASFYENDLGMGISDVAEVDELHMW